MISINVIIFSNYMFCEVYRSHPEGSGGNRFHPADIRRISGGYPPSGLRVPAPAEVLALSDSKDPRFGPRSQQPRSKTFAECDLGHPRLEPTLS